MLTGSECLDDSGSSIKPGDKVCFAAGQEHDLQLTLLALDESRAGDLDLRALGRRVFDFERTAAANLYAIAVDGVGFETIDAEACARIVDLQELDGRARPVLDGGVDMVGDGASKVAGSLG
jgi:hypothetical protein